MTYRQRKQRRRRRATRGKPLIVGLTVVGVIAAIAAMSAAGYVIAIAASAPALDELKPNDKGESSVIYAADGSRLGYVQSDEIRTPIDWEQMPADLRNATVAIEDENFYEHGGVDYGAIVRAGIKNLALYNDTRGNLIGAFNAKSLPITILLDREGRVVGRIEGAAQWDSAQAKALITHYLKDHSS